MWCHTGLAVEKTSPKQVFPCCLWFNNINISEHQLTNTLLPDQCVERNYHPSIWQAWFCSFVLSRPQDVPSLTQHIRLRLPHHIEGSEPHGSLDGLIKSCFCSLGFVFQDTRTCLLIWVSPGFLWEQKPAVAFWLCSMETCRIISALMAWLSLSNTPPHPPPPPHS